MSHVDYFFESAYELNFAQVGSFHVKNIEGRKAGHKWR